MNVTLFGTTVLQLIKLRLGQQGEPWLSMIAFIKKENVDTETDMHTQEKCHVNIKSELGVMHLQVKECQSLPADPQKREEKCEADSSS